jgi:protein TonB
LGASAGLLGALALAALTTGLTVRLLPPIDSGPPPITTLIEPPPASTASPAPPREIAPDAVIVADAPPLDVAAPEMPSVIPSAAAPIGPPTIANPRWLRRPTDLGRYYPRRAREMGHQGEVVLACLVSAEGALACTVESESPAGWGFAAAALDIAADHRMAPATQDGRAIEARYRMVVPFQLR